MVPTRSGTRILVVGGGYVGMYSALRLQRRLRPGEATLTVVDPQAYMTYQPFLPEAGAGNLEPRHVVVPLRKELRGATVLTGRITGIDHAGRTARFAPDRGPGRDIGYDVLILGVGSVPRTMPIPGLAEVGIGFTTVAEAIYLRNHVLARLDTAAAVLDPELRRRLLTFLFVGGGYAGVEALAELEDMARSALPLYPRLSDRDMRWVLVEAAERILPEVSPDLSAYTTDRLRGCGIEVRLRTRVKSLVGGAVELDDGESFEADTVVWTAGVRPNPLVGSTDLPLDEKNRVRCTAMLTVEGVADAWCAGDCAAVPDLTAPGRFCGPSAQHAVRQARRLADNVLATLRGEPPEEYRHAYAGSVASLGLHKGVAEIYRIKLTGWPAWLMHRTYHLSRMPTFNRKVRVAADWTLALLFHREIVSLGSFTNPRGEFERAAAPDEPARPPGAG
ncbi:MAG TPA: NAD(P)/FAD-dependent oxidoreductase [Mycobacteriales bacterium]|nr:NAD(P)/FAD-dependent oxidoreductase [Mycobacteriales bacterium]